MTTTAQFTVGTTRTKLVPSYFAFRTAIVHTASGSVYVGDSTVTSSNGYLIDQNDKITFPVGEYQELWAITGNGTTTVYLYSN